MLSMSPAVAPSSPNGLSWSPTTCWCGARGWDVQIIACSLPSQSNLSTRESQYLSQGWEKKKKWRQLTVVVGLTRRLEIGHDEPGFYDP